MKTVARLSVLLGAIGAAYGQSLSDCQSARRHGHLPEAKACYQKLAVSQDPYMRAEALWASRDFRGANDAFRLAVAQHPNNPLYKVRWGRMYLDHGQGQ